MNRLGFGDVIDMPAPTVGAGPPGNKAVVVGFLVTHPESNEVWMAWPEEEEELKLATDPGDLSPDVVKTVLKGARAKYYKLLGAAGEMVVDIFKMMSGGEQ